MRILRDYEKASKQLIKDFAGISTATIYESSKSKNAIDSKIKPLSKDMKLCGVAVTVKTAPKDNLSIHEAIYECKSGDVLVINVEGYTEAGYWGEIMTLAAIKQGIKGIIINGGVRDTEVIENLGFPVFCSNVCIKGTNKSNLGTINYPIVLGGIQIKPGDIVVGDRDGVVVIPLEEAKNTLKRSLERIEEENKIKEDLKSKSTVEIYFFDKKIKNLGGLK